MKYNNLSVVLKDGIATLTIDRPKAMNALNSETMLELEACLTKLEDEPDFRVLIITGGGDKAFVAGADIAEMAAMTAAEGRQFSLDAVRIFDKMEQMQQPIIAAVNGFALGGGFELAMACDIRIAADNAKFGHPECGLGILPGYGGTQRLPRVIGRARAMEMIFTGDLINADEALRMGIVNHVVPQGELLAYCAAMASRMLKNAPLSVGMAKQAIYTGLDMDLDSALKLEACLFGLAFSTADKAEGMGAFLEKRKEKHFTGK